MLRKSLLVGVLLALCGAALSACGGSSAPAEINITQQQYDTALAKWQSQNIKQYAVLWSETPSATNVEKVSLLYSGLPSGATLPAIATDPAPTPSSATAVDYDPVANLFNRISGELQSVANGYGSDYKYDVTFDPDRGYPATYSESCKASAPSCSTDKLTSYHIYKLQPLPAQAKINVTRQDYEAALTKWRNSNIADYQATIYELSLRAESGVNWIVQAHSNQLATLKDLWSAKPSLTATPVSDDGFTPSINELFRLTDQALNYTAQKDSLPMVYNVKFSPDFGYPTFYDQGCYEPEHNTQPVCPSDTFLTYDVIAFQKL